MEATIMKMKYIHIYTYHQLGSFYHFDIFLSKGQSISQNSLKSDLVIFNNKRFN